jgi:hypothetical protein
MLNLKQVTNLSLARKYTTFRTDHRPFRIFIFSNGFGLFLATNAKSRLVKSILKLLQAFVLFIMASKLREVTFLKLLPFIREKYNVK